MIIKNYCKNDDEENVKIELDYVTDVILAFEWKEEHNLSYDKRMYLIFQTKWELLVTNFMILKCSSQKENIRNILIFFIMRYLVGWKDEQHIMTTLQNHLKLSACQIKPLKKLNLMRPSLSFMMNINSR